MSKQPLPRYEDRFGSKYVSPDDLPAGKSVTVKILALEDLELACLKGGKVIKNMKIVATCEGCKKKIAINQTSGKRLGAAWGKDMNQWIGKSITVTGGAVNCKPAVLLAPVNGGDAPPTPDSDDLAFDGNIPESPE